jgi:RHS repeat-associated protein
MGDSARQPAEIISVPKGGGAMRGLGETFAPNLQTGTGNLSIPITVPNGRNGFQPQLALLYSSGNGNGRFGLGWDLGIPGITRKTSRGVPRYRDEADTFILSGSEDLVPAGIVDGAPSYRPRTEGLFARIVHRRVAATGEDYWEVTNTSGLTSRYGSARSAAADVNWRDPAVAADPGDPSRIFAWYLSETRDLCGNVIVYRYDVDVGHDEEHRWCVPLLRSIAYADYTDSDGTIRYLATVTFEDELRTDAFSSYSAGFELRTTTRCHAITTAVHTPDEHHVRRYELSFAQDRHNDVSLLQSVAVVGFDDDGNEHRDLPATTFTYGRFAPEDHRFQAVTGRPAPDVALSSPDYGLFDLTGDGLPDVIQLNGVARYWRNLGDGRLDMPRPLHGAPAGFRLADPGVQLLDADGDGRADLLVTTETGAGFFPLRFGPSWGRFHPYQQAPTFPLDDPQVRLVDLDGDGVTDVVRLGKYPQCFFSAPRAGWSGPYAVRSERDDHFPLRGGPDPRLRWADMTGDGLTDVVMVHGRSVAYWPNLGRGRFGRRVQMHRCPELPHRYLPERVLLADVDGDGLADVVFVGDGHVRVWFNHGGTAWSDPVDVPGVPGAGWDVRTVDLLGTGTAGVLWSRDATLPGRPTMYFLDLTGGVKPRLLCEIDNHLGAVTRVEYASSSAYCVEDSQHASTRWRTPLPFPVPVVSGVSVIDQVSRSKLSTTYHYRHGYYDGIDREFRGFAFVEQADTQTFADYHDGSGFDAVAQTEFSSPVVTRTWFYVGPVESEHDSGWAELDLTGEFWQPAEGTPSLHVGVTNFLGTLTTADGRRDSRARRDAIRALRGKVLRTELYGRDGSRFQSRPYTVTEHTYGLREETTAGEPARPRVFFVFETSTRTTEWERGDDPMVTMTFAGDYDGYGQPRASTSVALPRRKARRSRVTAAIVGAFDPDETEVIARHTRTAFASSLTGAYVHDRVAETRQYALVSQPHVAESDPADIAAVIGDLAAVAESARSTFDQLATTDVHLIGHVLHHYDGPAYTGLAAGELGASALLTRTEALAFTGTELGAAFGSHRPGYLEGPAAPPAGAPADFGAALGYRHEGAGSYVDGWYADTLRQARDVQLSTAADPLPGRGLILGTQDALGRETRITPDEFWLMPAIMRDPIGLERMATFNHRAGQVARVIDANGNATNHRYHPLGMLAATFVEGRDGEGDTEVRPGIRYEYDFGSFARNGNPVWVRAVKRRWHVSDGIDDETVESREYSDGLGRLLQTRTQAEVTAYPADVGLDTPNAALTATTDQSRVIVSGWEVRDNKGRVVRKYEPHFDSGWDCSARLPADRGHAVTMFYDPRGHVVRTRNPEGSERRTFMGELADLTDLDSIVPSPWVTTLYDENDLASVTAAPDRQPLATRAPAAHHFTPTTTISDSRGRIVCQVLRAGSNPASTWYATRNRYDARDNVIAVIDQLGRTAFSHWYDLLDRQLAVDSLDGGRRSSVLDAAGAVVQIGDERGAISLHTFDAAGRASEVHARDAPGQSVTIRERVIYGDAGDPAQPAAARAAARAANSLGRAVAHYDGAGVVRPEYDSLGRTLAQTRQTITDAAIAAAEPNGWTPHWGAAGAEAELDTTPYRVATTFDALDRPVEVRAPSGPGGTTATITARYGRSGLLNSLDVDGTTYVAAIAYDPRGQRLLMATGNGTLTRYRYDPATSRLTRLRSDEATATGATWRPRGSALQDYTYKYDLAGNATSIDDHVLGCGVAGSAAGRDRLVRAFTYDPLYRLRTATGRCCSQMATARPLDDVAVCGSYPKAPNQDNAPDVTSTYRETYTYDPVGNLTDLNFQITDGAAHPNWHRRFGIGSQAPGLWDHATSNRLTSVKSGAVTSALRYDDCGNLIARDNTRTYEWDHAGRLIGFQESAGGASSKRARYLYGADGMRVKKWLRMGGIESTTYVGTVIEHHRWARAGAGECRWLHLLDGDRRIVSLRSGDPHPDDAAPAIRYELSDHLGSACLTADAAGAWINREEYFPYGETSFGSFARKRYRFTGKERDEESGLAYHGARYYLAPTCRWISADPAGPVDGLALYTYVRGNPLLLIDRTGESAAAPLGTPAETPPAPRGPPDLRLIQGGRGLAATEGTAGEGAAGTAASGYAVVAAVFALGFIVGFIAGYYWGRRNQQEPSHQLDAARGALASGLPLPGEFKPARPGDVTGVPPVEPFDMPAPTVASADSARLRKAFMDWALARILAGCDGQPHPLEFLVDKSTGDWKSRAKYSLDMPAVQAGHLLTEARREDWNDATGGKIPELLAVEDATFNQWSNNKGETQKGIFFKDAIDICGVPVERRSALEYESAGLLPKGTVKAASPSAGWGAAGLVSVPVLTGACNLQQPDAGVPPRR